MRAVTKVVCLMAVALLAIAGCAEKKAAPEAKGNDATESHAGHNHAAEASDPHAGHDNGTLAAQTTCPVMGGGINKALYVDHSGRRIYVCCEACLGKIKADPETYIKKLEDVGQKPEKI